MWRVIRRVIGGVHTIGEVTPARWIGDIFPNAMFMTDRTDDYKHTMHVDRVTLWPQLVAAYRCKIQHVVQYLHC